MAKWNIGPKNGLWRGGRSIASNGYVLIRVGKDHHLSDVRGYAYEHRIVAEKKIGRKLRKGEIVHHLDGIKINNSPENIDVIKNRANHRTAHRGKNSKLRNFSEKNPWVLCACGCGKKFRKFDTTDRPKKWVSGHNGRKNG